MWSLVAVAKRAYLQITVNYSICTVLIDGFLQQTSTVFIVCITYGKSMDQRGKVANPVRGQLNRENSYFPIPVRA